MPGPEIEVGETLIIIRFGAAVDVTLNERAIGLAARLESRPIPGIRDIVPAYCSVGVYFDPATTDLRVLEAAVRTAAAESTPARGATETADAVVEIPTHYGGADGPDLERVAAWAGCTPDEVIRRHRAREYRVYMLGFVPGFAYLGRVDERIAAPRHETPRDRVPAGSVGIAGHQTGIYPAATPGGWQIVGRTSIRLFDASKTPPTALAPGQRVRFVAVEEESP